MNGDGAGTYFGLSGIDVGERPFEYPRGITLRKAYAFLMQPAIMAFAPAQKGEAHPAPWRHSRYDSGAEITSELFIPSSAASDLNERIALAQTIVFLLRLYPQPGVLLVVAANMAFKEIPKVDDAAAHLIQFPSQQRHFHIQLATQDHVLDGISWTIANLETALKLEKASPEFRLASAAFDAGQFYEETSLTMVSLWGALEAIFSPSAGELRFRVSALIASYLNPPGLSRHQEQQRIAKLYDKRSAAAHGRATHTGKDVFDTFELMRNVLIRFIEAGQVPSREALESLLFGA